MKRVKLLIVLCWVGLLFASCHAQTTKPVAAPQGRCMITFYNTENLFDTINDPNTNDDDFLPLGRRQWTTGRFLRKVDNIGRVLAVSGGKNLPDIIGLCEVENAAVLNQLTESQMLKKGGYKYVHFDSPDMRGIDVALLYRPTSFDILKAEPIKVRFPHNPKKRMRDILYVMGRLKSTGDTLHLLVNHFPSRAGGEQKSEPNRIHNAKQLKSVVDSLLSVSPKAYIVIMGDFNDTPDNKSMYAYLQARPYAEYQSNPALSLINLSQLLDGKIGSYYYNKEWQILDQMIVSSAFFTQTGNLSISPERGYRVFDSPSLRDQNGAPLRTFSGNFYRADGCSDHLPVTLEINFE